MSTTTSQYTFVRTLGKGTFGEVILAEKTTNPNVKVAMKKMVPKDRTATKLIKNEYLVLQALSKIGHINIMKMYGMQTDNINFIMYLEYIDGGNLHKKIVDGMSLEKAKFYFRQLVDGLFFIHENGVVHRDIKPDNLLLTKTDTLKIADFGFSNFYRKENGEERMLTMNCGTKSYAAPELFEDDPFRGPPVDVWSAGVVLAEMIIGDSPWKTATEDSLKYLEWISGCFYDEEPWTSMDADTIKFLRKILTDDVELRATIQQVKEDPWLSVEDQDTELLNRVTIEDESSSSGDQVESCNVESCTTEKRQRLGTSSE